MPTDAVEPASRIARLMQDLGVNAPLSELRQQAGALWRGIGPELEFAALAVWGGASLVQSVDAGRWTADSTERFKTPDLLVMTRAPDGQDVPFWVEVKSSSKKNVRRSARTYARMKSFQTATSIPYLLAYKFWNHIWILRELDSLRKVDKAYRLDEQDMLYNLMGPLLNDFSIGVPEGTGWYVELQRDDGRRADEPGTALYGD